MFNCFSYNNFIIVHRLPESVSDCVCVCVCVSCLLCGSDFNCILKNHYCKSWKIDRHCDLFETIWNKMPLKDWIAIQHRFQLTWTVDDSLFSGSLAQSRAVTTKLYIGIVSRSSACCVWIVPFDMIMKSLFSSPAVILYSMRPLYPATQKKKKENKRRKNTCQFNGK